MIYRRYAVPVLVASLWFGACGGDPPPEDPAPTPTTTPTTQPQQPDTAGQGAERERVRLENARQEAERDLLATVYFDYDESVITMAAEGILRTKSGILRSSPTVQLRVEGHADERGSTEYNLALGNRRAQAVKDYLVGFGLQANRFTVQSYGEERPAQMGSNERAWAMNRRAEFVMTAGQIVVSAPDRDDR
jgi:peptidoglycan-associated lipoprotein